MGHQPIPGTPQASFTSGSASSAAFVTGGNGTLSNNAIASAALKYEGYPYRWGGKTPDGWDCYGFLTYVLHHDLGYNLPNNTYTGYLEFLSWGGKYQISRAEVQAGDIVIWPTHCGIAINNTQMIGAENRTAGTRVVDIATGGPTVPEPISFYRIKTPSLVA